MSNFGELAPKPARAVPAESGVDDRHVLSWNQNGARLSKCKVPNCNVDVVETTLRSIRVCAEHQKAKVLHLKDGESRFCQQCRRIHPLERFEGDKRGCIQRLAHRIRRRQQVRKPAASSLQGEGAADSTDANMMPPAKVRKTLTTSLLNNVPPPGSDSSPASLRGSNPGSNPDSGSGQQQMQGSDGSGEQVPKAGSGGSETVGATRRNGDDANSYDKGRRPPPSTSNPEVRCIDDDGGNLHMHHGGPRAPSPGRFISSELPRGERSMSTEGSPASVIRDLKQQLEWQWQSSYQMGVQLQMQQQLQAQMARQLEWQGQMMYHLQQSLPASASLGMPPLPPMPSMPSSTSSQSTQPADFPGCQPNWPKFPESPSNTLSKDASAQQWPWSKDA